MKLSRLNWPAVTSGITAITAVGALIFTSLSLNASREQTALSEQGQITERYSRAIEQLGQQGPDRLQIRLGAMYALERLAHDSPRDQPTIIEVLATFVRTSVHRTLYPDLPLPDDSALCPADAPASPAPDVQAALTVLGRRDSTHDNTATIDLSRACLRGANLEDAGLEGTNLFGADLTDANLTDAGLEGAYLPATNLTDANLTDANLTAAELSDGHYATYPRSAKLYGAVLNGADLSGANLRGADLRASLTGADLSGADLTVTNLSGAHLINANLEGATHNEFTFVSDVRTDSATRGQWW